MKTVSGQKGKEVSLSEREREEIFDRLRLITQFRGSVNEYERWKGYACDILGASYRIPASGGSLDKEDVRMYNEGIEAIVNLWENPLETFYENPLGLPIKKSSTVTNINP